MPPACQYQVSRPLRRYQQSLWNLRDNYAFIADWAHQQTSISTAASRLRCPRAGQHLLRSTSMKPAQQTSSLILTHYKARRFFHEYFVTHLPSSSLHPDSGSPRTPHHKLPRSASTPHTLESGSSSLAAASLVGANSRDLTVVRIPLRSAKHHFGVSMSRGTRPYNEDAFQAGVIEMPAFARRGPISLTRSQKAGSGGEGTSAGSASGDPQVFYFGVFDGHGGAECSGFLRESLHDYLEESAKQFELGSSLKNPPKPATPDTSERSEVDALEASREERPSQRPENIPTSNKSTTTDEGPTIPLAKEEASSPPPSDPSLAQEVNKLKVLDLEQRLVTQWKELVGGYFRRFRPEFFSLGSGGHGHSGEREAVMENLYKKGTKSLDNKVGIESVLMYAFLKADLDFISAQLTEKNEDQAQAEKALNEGDILGEPSKIRGHIGGVKRFKGGSTCSIAMISTPTPTPFWHPASPCSVVISHVGDTRILLCSTSTGAAIPMTTNHHPSSPLEARRLRRYAATFVTDSFGEERMSGLANTRAFGDIQSKRIGVSAEPELRRLEVSPAEYSFMVLVSDGISGSMSDQEIVDIVKEARTPDQGARDVVGFATEVSKEGDNATCLVVRFGGWERRIEGGLGAMGTKEVRDWRRQEATDPRSRMT